VSTEKSIIGYDDLILITGGTGFIGSRVIQTLQDMGYNNLRCLVRSSRNLPIRQQGAIGKIEFVEGNLLSREGCQAITRNAAVIYHLAAGTGTKSFSDAFFNSVVTTRNLLDGAVANGCRRFVNVSSLTVYTNRQKPVSNLLDETCPVEVTPHSRGDAYCFAKTKQDELVLNYGREHGLRYVLVRPGVVYGPGKERIHGRIGLGTFGIFLYLGGANPIPFTHVENCAEAIDLAGLKQGVDGEAFNIVDDNPPSSRHFLTTYKKEVRSFRSIYIPHFASYLLCFLWEKYSAWSKGHLPPVYNRRAWSVFWKRTNYSNAKAKRMLEWRPKVSMSEGLKQFMNSCRQKEGHA